LLEVIESCWRLLEVVDVLVDIVEVYVGVGSCERFLKFVDGC